MWPQDTDLNPEERASYQQLEESCPRWLSPILSSSASSSIIVGTSRQPDDLSVDGERPLCDTKPQQVDNKLTREGETFGPEPSLPGSASNVAPRLRYTKTNCIILFCSSFAVFLMYLGVSIPLPFLQGTMDNLGASGVQTGVIFGIFPLSSSLFVPPASLFCLKIGRIMTLLLGLVVMGAAMVGFGLAEDSLPLLYCMRVGQGMGGAFAVVGATSIITHEFRACVGEAMGTREIFSGTAFVLGPTVGGLLYEAGGFKAPFLAFGLLTLCLSGPFAWAIRSNIHLKGLSEATEADREVEQGPGLASPVEKTSVQNSAIEEIEEDGPPRPPVTQTRLSFRDVVSVSTLLSAAGISLSYTGFAYTNPLLQEHFEVVLGASVGTVGLLFAVGALGYAGGAVLAGRLARSKEPKSLLLAGLLTGIISFALMGPVAGLEVKPRGLLWLFQVVGVALTGGGGGFSITAGYVLLELSVPRKQGHPEVCSSILTGIEGLVSSFAPIVSGVLVSALPQTTANCHWKGEEEDSTFSYYEACASGFPWAVTVLAIYFFVILVLIAVFLKPTASQREARKLPVEGTALAG